MLFPLVTKLRESQSWNITHYISLIIKTNYMRPLQNSHTKFW